MHPEIQKPSESEIAAARARAQAAGRGDIELLTYDELGVSLIVRALTLDEFKSYVDALGRNANDGTLAAFVDAVLWPEGAARELPERLPGLPREVRKVVDELAGIVRGEPRIALLRDCDDRKLERAGINPGEARRIAASSGTPVALVEVPGLSLALLMATPAQPIFNAGTEEMQEASAAGQGSWDVAARLVEAAVVWSPEPIRAILERWPGLATGDLVKAWARLGGAGAKATRKRL